MSNSYSLYLLRDNVTTPDMALKEAAKTELKAGTASRYQTEDFGSQAEAFVFRRLPVDPDWLKKLKSVFPVTDNIKNASQSALVIFQKDTRFFALPFGHAHHFIDPKIIVSDFGLKVALNCLSDKSVRGAKTANLSSAFRETVDSPFQRDIFNYGLDEAVELLRSLKGKPAQGDFTGSISGAQSLRFATKDGFGSIPELASQALNFFQAVDYKKTSFAFIDDLYPVLSLDLIDQLDDQMAIELKLPASKAFELGLPAVFDDTPTEYGFSRVGAIWRKPDLLIEDYRKAVGAKLSLLDAETLRRHQVRCHFDADGSRHNDLSVHSCLVGSIDYKGSRYAINEGGWYKLDDVFKKRVDDSFKEIAVQTALDKAIYFWPKKIDPGATSKGNKGEKFAAEKDYNIEISKKTGFLLFDAVPISLAERPNAKFELCDLLDIDGKRLIHVKRSGRRSSVLSHFFKQGRNSAANLALPEIKKKACNYVEKKLKMPAAAKRLSKALDQDGWTVEFHIADEKRKNGYTIPFFSRISLRDEAREIRKYGYAVVVKFIDLPKNP